jgi:hypothetical protein
MLSLSNKSNGSNPELKKCLISLVNNGHFINKKRREEKATKEWVVLK